MNVALTPDGLAYFSAADIFVDLIDSLIFSEATLLLKLFSKFFVQSLELHFYMIKSISLELVCQRQSYDHFSIFSLIHYSNLNTMVSTAPILALVATVANTASYVQAHGYIADPAPSWKGKKRSDWVVEIEPQWKGGWDQSSGDEGLLSTFKELATANNFKDVRSLMDGNPVYGEDCGYTDPNGTPVAPPSNGEATFSRGIVHAGPCEIWLDDKMVLQNDDCQAAYGDGTQETIAIFKPVDYSSCAADGCMLRFYWLALQRLDGKTVWQAYKNCIPLNGPAGGGGTSVQNDSPSSEDPNVSQQDLDEEESTKSPSNGESESSSSNSSTTDADAESPSSTPTSGSPSSSSPEMSSVPAPRSKCTGRRRE
ncbi:uncharacterized protein PHALS_05392 [Plasmopara halstedii]|uniref:Uncharacterized protein n=1 Tax=Plasmopara halstedii TaxID=4781 RepID=A0A0P1A9X5_PLAHL|nr:uncharacterized protein PHALS_05392 [Plasmopara halstedii]CEG37613.1 hypothetical protein PHALS_05392 [Plasmopara halstedii]|eukprot:XP_024573982.1 hypothetical protein PHALS_05392 [Plasmopara halstedii]